MIDAGRLFEWAWRILPVLPGPLVRGGFHLAALAVHATGRGGVRQLERNLTRISPRRGRELRALSREGLKRYLRYYAEVFQLPRMAPAQVDARVRTVNLEQTRRAVEDGTVVAALGHLGNWDLAGAWGGRNFSQVITVAEKLEPEALFQEFLAFREGLGMRIFAYEKGTGLFSELVTAARTVGALMPLLADRDLSSDGVTVRVCGHDMRVAPGPAAIALAAERPLIGVFIRHERLRGVRRRRAGSPWGIVIEFTDPIPVPKGVDTTTAARMMMQSWADKFSIFLQDHPEDWHMLQRCFLDDLDTERLAEADSGVFGE